MCMCVCDWAPGCGTAEEEDEEGIVAGGVCEKKAKDVKTKVYRIIRPSISFVWSAGMCWEQQPTDRVVVVVVPFAPPLPTTGSNWRQVKKRTTTWKLPCDQDVVFAVLFSLDIFGNIVFFGDYLDSLVLFWRLAVSVCVHGKDYGTVLSEVCWMFDG